MVKKVNSTPVGGIQVTRIRKVGNDGQTVELQLVQKFRPPVNNTSQLLSVLMEGHTGFSSEDRTRICWQNISTKKAISLGLIGSLDELGATGILICDKPFVLKDNQGNTLETKLVVSNTLVPRTWVDSNTGNPKSQQPKLAGKDGDILKYDNQPIYQNTSLAIPGMDFEDSVIEHNNVVVGSTVRLSQQAAQHTAAPVLPQ